MEESAKNNEIWEEVKETVQSFKKKLPKQISSPSLSVFSESLTDSLVNATGSLSLSLPSHKSIRERARTIGCDIRKLRSKSCERVLQRCRSGLEKVVRKDPQPADYFHQNATLRRSRRSAKKKAKPCSKLYDSYARAIVNYTPSPYDEDGLALCVGDLIGVINRHQSGMWVGECEGRVGRFKFINVELVETKSDTYKPLTDQENISSMSDLLVKLGLSHLTSKLELNGFDQLEALETVTRTDLEFLAISDKEEQDKLIEAAGFLRAKERKVERLDSGCFDCENNITSNPNIPLHRAYKQGHPSTLSSSPGSSLCSSTRSERKSASSTLSLPSSSQQDIPVFSSLTSLPALGDWEGVENGEDVDNVSDNDGGDGVEEGIWGGDRGRTQHSPLRRCISILSSCEGIETTF